MRGNKRRLYFSLFTLAALLVVAYITAKQSGWFDQKISSGEMPQSNFIVDTTALDRFVITKSTGETAELTKKENGDWWINNKYKAKPDGVQLIKKTLAGVKIKSRVGAGSRNSVIKNIAAYHRKVQFYHKGKWIKTWYVGNPSPDRSGTYFLLETPEDGKSENPYIMDLTRFHGQLDTRFYTEEEEWRYTGIFNYQPNQIKQIKFTSREKPSDGFTLNITDKNKIELLDYQGGRIKGFDTLTARAYTYGFKKIHYEHLAKRLTYQSLDSMKKAAPFYTITVTDKENKTTKVPLYQLKNYDKIVDLEGKELEYNPSRVYAILPTGEAAVVQYYSIDKILRPAPSFMLPPAPDNKGNSVFGY